MRAIRMRDVLRDPRGDRSPIAEALLQSTLARACAAAHRARGSYPPMVKPAAATLLLSFPSLTFS